MLSKILLLLAVLAILFPAVRRRLTRVGWALFGRAEIVIGVHGAGFTNMLFAPPSALLIELHPAGHLPEFYRHLTQLMGQRHHAIPGTITQSLHPALEYNWNFRVDPAEVDLFLAGL